MSETRGFTPDEVEIQERFRSLNRSKLGNAYLGGKVQDANGAYDTFVRERVGHGNPYGERLIREEADKDSFLIGRINYHLVRLLSITRSPAEQEFAQAFIDFAPDYYERLRSENASLSLLTKIAIGAESRNVTVWWTLSPYVYRHLVARGQTPEQAVQALCEWMQKAPEDDERVTLDGLAWIPNEKLFILEDRVEEIDGIPRIIRKGFISKVDGERVRVTDITTGELTNTNRSNIRLVDDPSSYKQGAEVLLLENGELPLSVTHQLASDMAEKIVVPLLLTD